MRDADQLARLRVAVATGHLPADLGTWALSRVLESVPSTERRARRDALLRAAAACVDGSEYAKACRVHESLCSLRLAGIDRTALAHESAAMLECVRAAHQIDPARPSSWRQVFNVITGTITATTEI